MEFPTKKKMELTYDPMIPLLRIYPNKPPNIHLKEYMNLMFITTLFAIAKIWKKPKCSLVNKWIKKL